ncbi:MAG: hydroxymethylbilane synthase, partial [Caldilineaceae bacterium]|nr:hydroxymethylbilane synthase [Caldilineaceae bacterium]
MQQTHYIAGRLEAHWPALRCEIVPFVTHGDRTLDHPLPAIGGKGLFTAELEAALNAGEIDIAVHSLKDLPVADSPGLVLGAIPNREDVRDVLVVQDSGAGYAGAVGDADLSVLANGAVVGTSSLRRQAQLLAVRPDLQVRSIRGNVETRLRKVAEGHYDATVLAAAGLVRVGLIGRAACYLPLELMLPAPGQGALAVQCREEDERTL